MVDCLALPKIKNRKLLFPPFYPKTKTLLRVFSKHFGLVILEIVVCDTVCKCVIFCRIGKSSLSKGNVKFGENILSFL